MELFELKIKILALLLVGHWQPEVVLRWYLWVPHIRPLARSEALVEGFSLLFLIRLHFFSVIPFGCSG